MRNIALEEELSALSRHLISPLSYWRTLSATTFAGEVGVVETSVASLISVSRLAPPELISELLTAQFEERVPVWNDLAVHFHQLDRATLGLCWDIAGSCAALSAHQLDALGLVTLLKALAEPYVSIDPTTRINTAVSWLTLAGTLLNPAVLSQVDWFQSDRGYQLGAYDFEGDAE
ncbi:hypothetical protein [Sphingomonas sp. UYP23]